MTATIIRLPDPEVCRFSATEANILRRLEEGARIDTIAHELGLAAPMVQEYIRSVLRKVRERADQQRP
jgi:DNA-binding NarL/FixJ family response regulator